MELITIVTPNNPAAADRFVWGCVTGFGRVLDAEFSVTPWKPPVNDANTLLCDFQKRQQTGVAWPPRDAGGWECFAP